MTRLRHYDDGSLRFVTFSCYHRVPVLTNERFVQYFLDALQRARTASSLSLFAFVIMPEHIHLIVQTPENVSLGKIIGEMKKQASHYILRGLKATQSSLLEKLSTGRSDDRPHAVWEKRFYDFNIVSEEKLLEKMEYCHSNPVTRNLVSRPDAWRYSSYANYHGEAEPVLHVDTLETLGWGLKPQGDTPSG